MLGPRPNLTPTTRGIDGPATDRIEGLEDRIRQLEDRLQRIEAALDRDSGKEVGRVAW